ncbi:MAG: YegS/Rv2252/BmrU family lipid kinase [Clostridia bacterium]|nr:YegS/Rv2252/BmrU family lipid kinase [Clostridia bacterium]
MKKCLLIINPCAGQKKANRFLPEIIRTVWDGGFECTSYITKAAGDATVFAREHGGEYDRVICIGGDGTLSETISGMMQGGHEVPIGYIPAGTTNDYAASVGLSSDVRQAAFDAVNGVPTAFDVGEFGDRYFTYVASYGAFTRTSFETPQNLKNALGHLAYLLEGVRELSMIRPIHSRIEIDGAVYEDDYIFGAVTNTTSVGGILQLDSSLVGMNDGVFEVLFVRNPRNAADLSQILDAIAAGEYPNEMVLFMRGKKLTVTTDQAVTWTLDGERGDTVSTAVMENCHGAVQLVLPSGD